MMKTSAKNKFLQDVDIELQHALSKFPSNEDNLTALMEELGELAQALLQQKHESTRGITSNEVYREAVQVAAMAMRIAIYGDTSFPDYIPS